jgi:hypothetical protein
MNEEVKGCQNCLYYPEFKVLSNQGYIEWSSSQELPCLHCFRNLTPHRPKPDNWQPSFKELS